MVRYFLLRDNRESGPYTLGDLAAKTLFTTDLIWVEGESRSWQHPTELTDLQELPLAVKTPPPVTKKQCLQSSDSVEGAAGDNFNAGSGAVGYWSEVDPDDAYTEPSFEALKARYAEKPRPKKVWQPQLNLGANLMGLVTLLIGLGLSAYMIKKAIENIEFNEPEIASATAVAIEPETLPSSRTTHAAFASSLPLGGTRSLVPDSTTTATQAAARLPVVPETGLAVKQGTTPETAKKHPLLQKGDAALAPQVEAGTGKQAAGTISTPTDETNADQENAIKQGENAAPDDDNSITKTVAKPALRLSVNKYEVGFLGGISNLEISVSNPSSQEVGQAVVEIEYLKPNGKVVSTQTVTVAGIAPGATKTVAVPDQGRGVTVRYKIVKTVD